MLRGTWRRSLAAPASPWCCPGSDPVAWSAWWPIWPRRFPGAALVPPGDRDALGRAIRSLATDAGLRAAMGGAARDRARLYSRDEMVSRYAAVYDEVLRGRLSGRGT